MTLDYTRTYRSIGFALLCIVGSAAVALGQSPATADLRGVVTDQTGGVVSDASVALNGGGIATRNIATSREGRYRFDRLLPGRYTVVVTHAGFKDFAATIDLKAKATTTLDVRLKVAIAVSVNVKDSEGVSAEARKNLSGLVLTGKDLAGLPDNPRLLMQRILEMAGSTGRPGDVAVYINGFREYKRLPPKSAIALVRINSNLFSAEFAQPNAQRVEIVTKAGSDTYHGDIGLQLRASPLEASDPITGVRPETRYSNYKGYVQGPIVKGHVGFIASGGYWEQDDNAFVHATVLAPSTLNPVPFSARIATPTAVTSQSAQADLRWGNDLVNASIERTSETGRNLGLQSGFDLVEHGYDRTANDRVARVWWTRIAGHTVNDLRIEINRGFVGTTPLSTAPAVLVLDAFNAGGTQTDWTERSTRGMQISDALTIQRGAHTVKTGFQIETMRQHSVDLSGFGGSFTFGADVERDRFGQPILGAGGQLIGISPIERYRRTVLGLPGYVPSQYFIVRGDPEVSIEQRQIGWFVLDDWSPSRRMSLSYGVRHEMQNDIKMRLNLAPRAGFSWLLDDQGKSAIKLGGGLFYTRVGPEIAFDTKRLDGINRHEYTIESPSFFTTPVNALDRSIPVQSTTYTKSDDLRNPLAVVSTASYERQLSPGLYGVVQYLFSRGSDLLRLRSITAPLAGSNGPAPDPVLQFESTGRSLQHQVMFGLRQNLDDVSLYANYTYGTKRRDTDGPYTLPADSHDLSTEYGWAADDQRHYLVAGATMVVDDDLLITPSLTISSGRPFNITTGRDNNNDTRFTDRPAFAEAGSPSAIETRFGRFDPSPTPGAAIIPRNYGREPRQINVDVSATKTLRHGVMLTIDVQNLFNYTRLYGSTGVLTSEIFGTPNQALNGRRLWVTVRYGF